MRGSTPRVSTIAIACATAACRMSLRETMSVHGNSTWMSMPCSGRRRTLVGTHDFRAMSSVNKRFKKSTVRTITQITITRKPREICFDVIGTGFLYNMVRILIGTLVEVGEGKRAPDSMPAILDSLDRQQAGVTPMPPQGLTLETVLY